MGPDVRRLSTLERAYEIVRSGSVSGMKEIKRALKAEGYEDIDGKLFGAWLNAELRRLCDAARNRVP